MLNGTSLWPPAVTAGMSSVSAHGREVEVFDDAPGSLYESLSRSAERFGDADALVFEGRTLSHVQLKQLVDALGSRLAPWRGKRVALVLDTSLEFALAVYAISRAGAVAVPIPVKLRREQVEQLVVDSRADLVLATTVFRDLVVPGCEVEVVAEGDWEAIGGAAPCPPAVVHPDDDFLVMHTSGTTARSKGVVLTNRAVTHAFVAYERVLGLTRADVGLLAVPIYYITGFVALLALFIHLGAPLHVHRRFKASKVLEAVVRHEVTFIHASPTVFALLLREREKFPALPSLRMLACGAAHMPAAWIRQLHDWMPTMEFRTIYGLTETSSPATAFDADAAVSDRILACGKPVPGVQLSIRDNDGAEVAPGESGTVFLRGTNLLRTYEGAGATELADAWLDTGDVGYVDDQGYLFVVDRKKDVINRGGEKVWCIDVEERIRQVPGVADAAVVGVPDPLYGEACAAVVVPAAGAQLTGETVIEDLRKSLLKFQLPVLVEVAAELPLTPTLKVDKREIRRRLTLALQPAR